MFCKQCGAELEKEALFCSDCGAKVEIIDGKKIAEEMETNSNEGVVEETGTISDSVESKMVIDTDNNQKKPKGKKIGLIVGIIALIIVALLFMGGSKEKWIAESALINDTYLPLHASEREYYLEIKGDDFKLGVSDADDVVEGNLIVMTEEGKEVTYILESYDGNSMGYAMRTMDEGEEVFYLATSEFEMIFKKK